MNEARRLVGLGRVLDATATIQRALSGVPLVTPRAESETGAHAPPLEGNFTILEDSAPEIFGIPSVEESARDAQFLTGAHKGATDSRRYKLYVPSCYSGRALPLLVMLHGCTQSPDDAAAGTGFNRLAEERGWLVLYPAQSQAANPQKCWNWFRPGDQHKDGGEAALLAGMTREIMATWAVDARRVYVAGLSAGGAMAAVLGATHADLFAAIGVHSGLAYRIAHDVPSALTAMHGAGPTSHPRSEANGRDAYALAIPTIVFHGDRDTTVSPANSERIIAQCAAAMSPESAPRVMSISGRVPGGRSYTRRTYEDANGYSLLEHWLVHGAGHAWSGGHSGGSYVDPQGPDAAQEMMRFFEAHPRAGTLDG